MRVSGRVLMLAVLAAASAYVYLLSPENSVWYWQCPFHAWTGLLCPGCGGTRAVHALLHGEFVEAMRRNALAVILFCASWSFFAARWCPPLLERMQLGSALAPRRPQLILFASVVIAALTLVRNLGF